MKSATTRCEPVTVMANINRVLSDAKKSVVRMLANGLRMPYNHKRTAFVGSLLPAGSCAMPIGAVTGERFDG